MPGPTILRPAMSTSPVDTLTPTQQLALLSVRVGDIVLVEPESSSSSPAYFLLVDTITSIARDSIIIASKARYDITQANLFDCQRYGTWNFQSISHNWPRGDVLENSLNVRDTLTLNPPIELLRAKFMGGKCLYQNCREGLVHKSVVTVNDVHFRETEARAGRGVWTLCPFCMGWELQQRHECLVTCTIPDRYAETVRTAHLQAINLKRLENDYSPLPWDIDLVVLDGQRQQQQQQQSIPNSSNSQSRPPSPSSSPSPQSSTQRRTRTIRHPLPQPITQTRHSSRPTPCLNSPDHGPRLSSHSLSWFHTAHERVLNDICGLCQEEYRDGERIVDLLCEHFYHERCLEKCFEVQREMEREREIGGRGRGKVEIACPLCRREVVS